MALFSREFNGLNDLFVMELEDLYDAETRLTAALPKMADAASSGMLKVAFQTHLSQTQNHVRRLEQVLGQLGVEPKRETCDAMKGLIKEGEVMIKAKGDEQTRDAGLIAAAQKVEHYEIASYGTVRTYAHQLGRDDLARILQQTLDEERDTDQKLTQIAETQVNVHA
jgi:ferritin-like metal-binding protein YciE